MRMLDDAGLKQIEKLYLKRPCGSRADCRSKRQAVLDKLIHVGTPLAQRLLLIHGLRNTNATEEEKDRTLIHIIGIKDPIPVYVYYYFDYYN